MNPTGGVRLQTPTSRGDDLLAQVEEAKAYKKRLEAAGRAAEKAAFNAYCFRDAKGEPQVNNWHHLKWFDLAELNDRLLVEAAREHSKTQVFATTTPLYEIFADPNVRILLVSDNYSKSQERCKVLKEHIYRNRYIPEFMGREINIWSRKGDEEFTVTRPFYWLKEPTVRSTYAGGPIAGGGA